MSETVIGRYRVLAAPRVRPGHCRLCLGNTGPFIETGISVEWEGALYICGICVDAMTSVLADYRAPEISEEVVEEVSDRYNEGFAAGVEAGKNQFYDLLGTMLGADASGVQPPSDFSPDAPVQDVAGAEDLLREVAESDGDHHQSTDGSESVVDGGTKQGRNANRKSGRSDVSGDSSDGPVFDL